MYRIRFSRHLSQHRQILLGKTKQKLGKMLARIAERENLHHVIQLDLQLLRRPFTSVQHRFQQSTTLNDHINYSFHFFSLFERALLVIGKVYHRDS